MRYLAVEETIGHFDGIGAWYIIIGNHNFYIYEFTDTERVVLIAWDLDNSLFLYGVPNVLVDIYSVPAWDDLNVDCERYYPVFNGLSAKAATCDPFMRGLASVMWSDYADATRQFIDTLFTEKRIGDQIDSYAQLIEEAIADDERGPSFEEWRSEVERLKGSIGDLRQRALNEIIDH